MPRFDLQIDQHVCQVTLTPGSLNDGAGWLRTLIGDAPACVIADTAVAALHQLSPVPDLSVIAGDQLKSLDGLRPVYDLLQARALPREGVVVAMGGGSLSDAVGFAAATWLRGVPWVAMPTTLLSMVDASIGGKVAINYGGVKNQIGAFHQPSGILLDPAVLTTLPLPEWLSGMGEVLKTACLDATLFQWLTPRWESLLTPAAPPSDIMTMLESAIRIKGAIVMADPTEQGMRRQLNLGHTLGHALESGWESAVPHGQCVALGLLAASELGVEMGLTDASYATQLAQLVVPLWPGNQPWPASERLSQLLVGDKKRRHNGEIRWQIPVVPGEVTECCLSWEAVPWERIAAKIGTRPL